jgi:hypothetical protein
MLRIRAILYGRHAHQLIEGFQLLHRRSRDAGIFITVKEPNPASCKIAVDAGQRTGWSPKVYVGALIALAATILTFVVKDYWIVSRSSRRTTDAAR